MPRKSKKVVEVAPVVVEEVPVAVEPAKPEKKKRKSPPEARERMTYAQQLIKSGKSKSEAVREAWKKFPSKKSQSS